jgi:hypothetical protein
MDKLIIASRKLVLFLLFFYDKALIDSQAYVSMALQASLFLTNQRLLLTHGKLMQHAIANR